MGRNRGCIYKYLVIAIVFIILMFTSACGQGESEKKELTGNTDKTGSTDSTNKTNNTGSGMGDSNRNKVVDKNNINEQYLYEQGTNIQDPNIQNKLEERIANEKRLLAEKEERLEAKRINVKGIYVSGWIAGSHNKMEQLIKLLDSTELNTMVIDVKNDSGEVTYKSNVPEVNAINSDRRGMISDISNLMKELKGKNIYTIARVVVFKDPFLSGKHPNLAMHHKDGQLWKDSRGVAWVDPYQQEVWRYNIAIAEEAAELGFDEIQFDYVRFPENGAKVDQEVRFQNPENLSKSEVITKFLIEAKKQLEPKGVFISADVFGLVTSTSNDMGIGQEWSSISQVVDYISPMVYPSHYSKGMYGLAQPDLKPYEVVKQALKDGKRKNSLLLKESKKTAIIRPWLQSFTATWIDPHLQYGTIEVEAQIKAAREQEIEEFLLWNALCKYSYR